MWSFGSVGGLENIHTANRPAAKGIIYAFFYTYDVYGVSLKGTHYAVGP